MVNRISGIAGSIGNKQPVYGIMDAARGGVVRLLGGEIPKPEEAFNVKTIIGDIKRNSLRLEAIEGLIVPLDEKVNDTVLNITTRLISNLELIFLEPFIDIQRLSGNTRTMYDEFLRLRQQLLSRAENLITRYRAFLNDRYSDLYKRHDGFMDRYPPIYDPNKSFDLLIQSLGAFKQEAEIILDTYSEINETYYPKSPSEVVS